MVIGFQVSTRRSGRKATVQVRVYDDLDRLRREARAWSGGDDLGDAVGVAQHREVIGTDGAVREYFYIRYFTGALGIGVVSHEAAHIAARIHGCHLWPRRRHPGEGIAHEEILCHLVGELTSKIVAKLYAYHLYK